jgi:hypothetical protein
MQPRVERARRLDFGADRLFCAFWTGFAGAVSIKAM